MYSKRPNSLLAVTGIYASNTIFYLTISIMTSGFFARLSSTVQNQIKGVVLFGYTQTAQNGGTFPNFSNNKTDIVCSVADAGFYSTLFIFLRISCTQIRQPLKPLRSSSKKSVNWLYISILSTICLMIYD